MLFNGLNSLAAAAQQAQPQGDIFSSMIPLVIIIVIFYFLLFAPMRKQRKQLQQTIASLQNGDKVVTQGGIYGVIAGVSDDRFQLKIANNVKIEVSKNAIAGKVPENVSK
ncbi:MAG: preprotein translocase subunit YajC [Acidobacteria bacterium]|nr:preprotein translocase subunit YajC [Acidobacteriota bacterium]